MRLPSTVCLHLALLGLAGAPTVALAGSSSPHEGTEGHDITLAEDVLAGGVAYTFVRYGNPKKPFTLAEGTADGNPVKIRSVKSAPAGLSVSFSGSTFVLKGRVGGTVVFETQFRDVAVSIGVDKAPLCDSDFRRMVPASDREVLVDPADLCIDPEGVTPVVDSVKALDGSELKVTYNDDGTATVDVSSGGGSGISYRVKDNGNIGEGVFTPTVRDWNPILRVAGGGDTTFTETDLADDLSTKEDPLKAVAIDIVDEDEQLAVTTCCGGFTLTTRDWDPILRSPVVDGEFVDADDTPVYATWEVEYNEVATCTEGEVEVGTKETKATLSLFSYCKDAEGDALTVEGVTVDGKVAEYAYDAKTGALTVYLPYTKEAGGTFKVQAKVGNNGDDKYDPKKDGVFTIVFRDNF